ncbi:MAG: hypothetical protein E7649_01645 [Ruminococcaceae bacterium]|nr:hypothetical protein [Oscillospiraceae bacterium]
MNTNKIFTILGGDKRQAVIARCLIKLGHTVRVYGLGSLSDKLNGVDVYSNWLTAIRGSNIILLPLPTTRDGATLSLRQGDMDAQEKVLLSDILIQASKSNCECVIGGVIPKSLIKMANELNIAIYDYYDREDLQKKNALPSAEGALMLAMENTEKVIKGMSVLICGYGRIGKSLSDILYKLGADITVAARREESLCEAAMMGYKTAKINSADDSSLCKSVKSADVIFNTVPHLIFNSKILECADNKPLYIEIASSPGGIDLSAARNLGIEVVFAPSIPGKYAPISAGEYIFETIHDILRNRGIYV